MKAKLAAGALAGLFLLLAAWLFGPEAAGGLFDALVHSLGAE